jgi:thioredoxin-like negative regulator of GroEL
MPARLLILGLVVLAVTIAVMLARRWNARHSRALASSGASLWDALGEQPDGRRALVAFSTPSCAACHTAQAPAIQAAAARLGVDTVRVIRVDASQQPAVARAFGIMTVPSTVVLEPAGRVVALNQGFAPSGRLVQQLQRAA